MIEDKSRKRLPPYISYHSFRSFLEELQQGVPARIDRSFWGERMSGSTGNQLVAALRFLGLIDTNAAPTERLRKLTLLKGTSRADHLKQITVESFSFLSGKVDTMTGTYSQLEEAFQTAYPLTPDVRRKCIKFYVAIAGESGINLSSFITKRLRTKQIGIGIKGIPRRKNSRTENTIKIPQVMELIPDATSWDKLLLEKFPDLDPAWNDELKLSWFKDFDILLRIRPGKNGL